MSSSSSSATGIMNTASASVPKTSSKRVVKKTDDSAVAAPVAVSVAAPVAPVATKVTKAKASASASVPVAVAVTAPAAPVATKAAKASASVTVATPAVASTTDVAAPVVAVEEARLETEAKAITSRLLLVRETVSELISEAKRLEKKAAKLQKVADKRRRNRVPKPLAEGEEPKPVRISIFQVPTPITPALCAFMGRPSGSLESRSNVTKYITTYVKENNLKNKHDINGDAKLLTLLNLKAEDKLTYFNLQKYLNVHYIKNVPAATATATVTA